METIKSIDYRKQGDSTIIVDEWNSVRDDSTVIGYFENKKSGQRYYSLFASWDAKLDLETGFFMRNTAKGYSESNLLTINELFEEGLLFDYNYDKHLNRMDECKSIKK